MQASCCIVSDNRLIRTTTTSVDATDSTHNPNNEGWIIFSKYLMVIWKLPFSLYMY